MALDIILISQDLVQRAVRQQYIESSLTRKVAYENGYANELRLLEQSVQLYRSRGKCFWIR